MDPRTRGNTATHHDQYDHFSADGGAVATVGTIPHQYGTSNKSGSGLGMSGGTSPIDTSSTAAALEKLASSTTTEDVTSAPAEPVPEVPLKMPVPRRRVSRWETPSKSKATEDEKNDDEDGNGGDDTRKRRRKSRWNDDADSSVEQRELQTRLDSLTRIINGGQIPIDELCRSPSPEPIYDARGRRINTRADRARDKLEAERHVLCDRLKEMNPNFRPPARMHPQKYSEKIYLPVKEFPNTNFIGLILGPRGNTHKRLEKDYDVRVAIRGKGSVKDGRQRGPPAPDDNDELHVVVSGEGNHSSNTPHEGGKRF